MASARSRNAILVAVVLPLWANYVVRVFAWQLILSQGGFLAWLFGLVGLHVEVGYSQWGIWLTFVYLWLPFTMLPIYAHSNGSRLRSSRRRATSAPRGGSRSGASSSP